MTNRFCIPMGARYARPSVSPWMNTDSKSTDVPYRPSKAPGIARCTTLLMIAYGDAWGLGDGMRGRSEQDAAAEVRASGMLVGDFATFARNPQPAIEQKGAKETLIDKATRSVYYAR